MRRVSITACLLLAGLAFALPAGRSLVFDIATGTDNTFSNVMTAGEAFDWEVRLVTNGVAITDTLSGWMGYATSRTAGAWVRFPCVTNAAGVCYFRMSVTASTGLSTNPADYPVSYPASIILTNSTGTRAYRLRAGTITIRRDSAVSETIGAAVAQ